MVHLGWILPAVGGILTTLMGHVGKYSYDKANELKELIVKIGQKIADLEGPPSRTQTTGWMDLTGASSVTIRVNEDLSKYASELESKLELIRCFWLMQYLAQLPPKKNVEAVAKLLRELPEVEKVGCDSQPRDLCAAGKIKNLLAYRVRSHEP
jgi:hypothetical protein